MEERDARILLNMVPGIGPVHFRKLLKRFGQALDVWQAPPEEWKTLEGFSEGLLRVLEEFRGKVSLLNEEKTRIQAHGARVLIEEDEDYPRPLTNISDPPPILYLQGTYQPQDALAVALVGTRRLSAYGRSVAEGFSRDLARAGVTTVSGLARGIDTVVHTATLEAGGRTLAVLGSGLGRCYPPENKGLMKEIAQNGAVLSEFPILFPPDRGHFPRRNRIITGLSLGVVVIEADLESGALISARLAAEQGRDVFAVPGSIWAETSRGTHLLIQEGAKLTQKTQDIIEELLPLKNLLVNSPLRVKQEISQDSHIHTVPLGALEEKVLESLSFEPTTMETLCQALGEPPHTLTGALLSLESKRLVIAQPGQRYAKLRN